MSEPQIHPDAEALAQHAADWLLAWAAATAAKPGERFSVCLSGGSTPKRSCASIPGAWAAARAAQPLLFRRGRETFVQDGHTEKLRIEGPVVPLTRRLLHDDRKSIERWLQSQSRYQASEAEKLTSRPWSELSWPDRLRCTRVLGPIAVAVHCLFVKGLIFDGSAGLLYTAQRVTADLILSMHLLRRDIAK